MAKSGSPHNTALSKQSIRIQYYCDFKCVVIYCHLFQLPFLQIERKYLATSVLTKQNPLSFSPQAESGGGNKKKSTI